MNLIYIGNLGNKCELVNKFLSSFVASAAALPNFMRLWLDYDYDYIDYDHDCCFTGYLFYLIHRLEPAMLWALSLNFHPVSTNQTSFASDREEWGIRKMKNDWLIWLIDWTGLTDYVVDLICSCSSLQLTASKVMSGQAEVPLVTYQCVCVWPFCFFAASKWCDWVKLRKTEIGSSATGKRVTCFRRRFPIE